MRASDEPTTKFWKCLSCDNSHTTNWKRSFWNTI